MKQRLFTLIFSFFLFLSVLLSCFLLFTFSLGYYDHQYARLGVYDSMPQDDALLLTTNLLQFLRGDNELDDRWNTKEKLHMRDVRRLFDGLRVITLVSFLCVLVLGGLSRQRSAFLSRRARLALLFLVLGGGLMLVFFPSLFFTFHTLAFSNDLWMMNPAVDIMGKLFPAAFFFAFLVDVFTFTALILAILAVRR